MLEEMPPAGRQCEQLNPDKVYQEAEKIAEIREAVIIRGREAIQILERQAIALRELLARLENPLPNQVQATQYTGNPCYRG